MPSESKRTVTTYLVLERSGRRGSWNRDKARVVRHSSSPPELRRGECAVMVTVEVADSAFEPRFATGKLSFAVEDTLQATVKKETP